MNLKIERKRLERSYQRGDVVKNVANGHWFIVISDNCGLMLDKEPADRDHLSIADYKACDLAPSLLEYMGSFNPDLKNPVYHKSARLVEHVASGQVWMTSMYVCFAVISIGDDLVLHRVHAGKLDLGVMRPIEDAKNMVFYGYATIEK